jgi:hypothetical protein
MNAFWQSSVSPAATSARHPWRIKAANALRPLAATASVAGIGAAVGMAAGVPGMLAGTVLGGLAGLLATRALDRPSAVGVYDDAEESQVRIGPPSQTALRHPTRAWRAMVRWIARTVGVATMFLGLLCAACAFAASGLLWAADDYRDPDPAPAVLFASILGAVLIGVGFAIWSASSRLRHQSAGFMPDMR